MKIILAILLLFLAVESQAEGLNEPNFRFLKVSYINILGKTNVNSFTFYLDENCDSSFEDDVIPLPEVVQDNQFNIPVKDLQTESSYMYSDFLTLLREPEYPQISIKIDETAAFFGNGDSSAATPEIEITLAGVAKRYQISCNIENEPDSMLIKGTARIRLTDFNLEPPTKMLGMVKVKDEIDIKFGILCSTN